MNRTLSLHFLIEQIEQVRNWESNQFNFSYYQVSTTLETGGPLGIPGYLHYNVH